MKKIRGGAIAPWKDNSIKIFCALNDDCNLHCTYCINRKVRNVNKKFLPEKAMMNLIRDLAKLNRKNYHIATAGGEPTIYPYLLNFYKHIETEMPKKSIIALTTNGSNMDKLVDCINSSPNVKHVITISMHLEQIGLDKYLKVLKFFPHVNKCTVKLLLLPGQLEQAQRIQNHINLLGYKFVLTPLFEQNVLSSKYSEEELKIIQTSQLSVSNILYYNEYTTKTGDLVSKTFNQMDCILDSNLINYTNMKCMAGHSFLRILTNGEVTCCHHDWQKEKFSILEKTILNYPALKEPIVCKSPVCPLCNALLILPKWDPEFAEGPEYFIAAQKEKSISE